MCFERVRLAHVARDAADDDAELDFPVHLDRAAGLQHRVVRADDAARGLHEDDGLARNLRAGFGGVIRVVEADGDEFADAADAGAEPRARGSLAVVWLASAARELRSEVSGPSAAPARSGTTPERSAMLPSREHETWALRARGAKTYEFQVNLP